MVAAKCIVHIDDQQLGDQFGFRIPSCYAELLGLAQEAFCYEVKIYKRVDREIACGLDDGLLSGCVGKALSCLLSLIMTQL